MQLDSKNNPDCELQRLGSSVSVESNTTSEATEQRDVHWMVHEEDTVCSQSSDQVLASSDITPTNVESRSFSITVVEIERPNSLEPEEDNRTIVGE